jgi:hypothetical protein
MKITDKMRLDWLDGQREEFHGEEGNNPGVYYRCGDYYDLSKPKRNVRQAIDAAIRAGERNKI